MKSHIRGRVLPESCNRAAFRRHSTRPHSKVTSIIGAAPNRQDFHFLIDPGRALPFPARLGKSLRNLVFRELTTTWRCRYVLVKAGSGAARSSQPTPTKLEEALLRQRFPGQHRAMLRSMEKAFNGDSMTSHSIRRDNDQPAKLSDDIRIAQSSFQLDDVTMA